MSDTTALLSPAVETEYGAEIGPEQGRPWPDGPGAWACTRGEAAVNAHRPAKRKQQYSQPETPTEHAICRLRSHWGARLVLLRENDEGELVPAWRGWNSCKPPGSGQCIDHLRSGGAIGWQPDSFDCIVVDADHGDAAKLAMKYPPLAYLETRRLAHLVYRKVDLEIIDNTRFEWEGLTGELKSTGLCRFHGSGAERLAAALAEADGGGPTLPLELLRPSQALLARRRGGNRRAPRLSLLPRHDEVHEGKRDVSLFEIGRHATYRFTYEDLPELERMCIEHAFAIAESFPCDPESEPKIRATGRSWARYKWRVDTGKLAPRAGTGRRAGSGKADESARSAERDASDGGTQTRTPDTPPPGDPQGGMIKAGFTPPRPVGHGSVAQQRRSHGGKVKAERSRATNRPRDERIWRLRDEGMSYRGIEKRLKGTKHAVSHTRIGEVIKEKPVGQGERDKTIRLFAVWYGKGRGRGHLTKVGKKVGLPSAVVREWLALPPGPDYVNEREARRAARANRKRRDPTVRQIRKMLRQTPEPSAASVASAFPGVDRSIIEEQIEWKHKADARARYWAKRRGGRKRKDGDGNDSSARSKHTHEGDGKTEKQNELMLEEGE